MIWIYSVLGTTSTRNRLALFIAGLRGIGILGFALLSGYFVTQDAYLEIHHLNTNGLGLDRGNNRSNGPGARTLSIIGYLSSASRLTAGVPEFGSRACARQVGTSGAFPQCLAPRAQRPELSRKVEWGLALPWRPPQGYQMPVGPYARRCAARAEAQRRLAQARY